MGGKGLVEYFHGRPVAERRVQAPAVVEPFDVADDLPFGLGSGGVGTKRCSHPFLRAEKNDSAMALSQQTPLRSMLIGHIQADGTDPSLP